MPSAAAVDRITGSSPRQIPEYRGKAVEAPAFAAPSHDLADWVRPVPGRPLEFRTTGQATDVTLVPLNAILDERYAVYWKVQPPRA